ncbi:MAG TPA: 50S ribosomal protein L25/general stress protein Ctc, partial [Pseudolabrys sp.]|nr:50S ribosomal protein L25/general stress protein Ctc [Pseudolabrys sp.]
MATVQELKATVRPKGGKGAARAARRSGNVPGVIYGENKPPMMVLLDHAELRKRIYAGRFLTTLYNLDVEGTKHRVIPRDFQLDPVKDLPMHVDFLRVSEGAVIRVKVAVHVLNSDQSPGVKRGGAVNIVTHTVDVMCPAEAIPESIDVDISGLDINHSKHLS